MNAVHCNRCGTAAQPGSRFCMSCGGRMIQSDAARTVFYDKSERAMRTVGEHLASPSLRSVAPARPTVQTNVREHLVLILDQSGSMKEWFSDRLTKLQAVIRAAVALIMARCDRDPDDWVGLITFSDRAWSRVQPGPVLTSRRDVIKAIQSMGADGGTNMADALSLAESTFDWSAPGVTRRIVLQTDGYHNVGRHPNATADRLKAQGVIIETYGIGSSPSDVDEALLRNMASAWEGQLLYKFIKNSPELIATFVQTGTIKLQTY